MGRGSRYHAALDQQRWRKLRFTVLEAAGWACTGCGRYANEVDHVQPLHKAGAPYDTDNLQALCRGCHIAKTRAENSTNLEKAAWRAFVAR